uniref:Putative coronin n=1 Tax=Rhipicephalus microplus TaxID=6941 RepID=A0A6G5AFS3_RHIMP
MTRTTRRPTWAPAGRLTPSEALHTQRALCSKKLVLKPSSPTLPSGSVSECSSSRTAKRSQPSCPGTVASTTLRRTTRSWWQVSVVRVMPWVTSPVSVSRWSKSPTCPCSPCTRRRKSDHAHRAQ